MPFCFNGNAKTKGVAKLPDWDTIMAFCGAGACIPGASMDQLAYTFLKDRELTEAVTRYRWSLLPKGVDAQILERILYYKGQGCLFYLKATDKFYFLPFTYNGSIDCYGRYNSVTPLPFHGAVDVKDKDGKLVPFIPGLELEPIYSLDDLPDDYTPDNFEGKCIILHDRPIGINQKIIPREQLNDVWNQMMSECPAMGRTNLLRNSGVSAWRVGNEDDQGEVESACDSLTYNALNGRPFMGVISQIEMQDLTSGGRVDAEQFYQVMQSLDSIRLMGFGMKSNGMFDKDSAYVNNQQIANMQQNIGLIYEAGLNERQKFADLITFCTGIMTDCQPSESITNFDMDGNGIVGDDDNMESSGDTGVVNTMEEDND